MQASKQASKQQERESHPLFVLKKTRGREGALLCPCLRPAALHAYLALTGLTTLEWAKGLPPGATTESEPRQTAESML